MTGALDGPGSAPRPLAATPSNPTSPAKLYEAVAGTGPGALLRSAVWDVTGFVAAAGAGTYTVADILSQRAGPYLPYASWAMVVAYELDPAVGLDRIVSPIAIASPPACCRGTTASSSSRTASVDVAVPNVDVRPGTVPFGKSLHVVAGGRSGQTDNLLLAGEPLGNNNSPGDSPAPGGLVVGSDPACNVLTDVQNDSICVLGTNVAAKAPGAADFVSSADGTTPSSGSGVDIDVIRIPDRYLRTAGTRPVLRVRATEADAVGAGRPRRVDRRAPERCRDPSPASHRCRRHAAAVAGVERHGRRSGDRHDHDDVDDDHDDDDCTARDDRPRRRSRRPWSLPTSPRRPRRPRRRRRPTPPRPRPPSPTTTTTTTTTVPPTTTTTTTTVPAADHRGAGAAAHDGPAATTAAAPTAATATATARAAGAEATTSSRHRSSLVPTPGPVVR